MYRVGLARRDGLKTKRAVGVADELRQSGEQVRAKELVHCRLLMWCMANEERKLKMNTHSGKKIAHKTQTKDDERVVSM